MGKILLLDGPSVDEIKVATEKMWEIEEGLYRASEAGPKVEVAFLVCDGGVERADGILYAEIMEVSGTPGRSGTLGLKLRVVKDYVGGPLMHGDNDAGKRDTVVRVAYNGAYRGGELWESIAAP